MHKKIAHPLANGTPGLGHRGTRSVPRTDSDLHLEKIFYVEIFLLSTLFLRFPLSTESRPRPPTNQVIGIVESDENKLAKKNCSTKKNCCTIQGMVGDN